MKDKVRKERGITLIALVITIIVLLILAGVSLSLIVGQNGVLNKATESVSATKKGTAIEQVSLAWTACQTDYLENNNGNEKSTFFTKEKLNENLSQGEVTEVNFEKDANGSEVKYKLDNTTYTVIVSNDGIVKIAGEGGSEPVTPPATDGITLSDINANPSEYYGKKVTGYTANGISDWRIFYADNTNVFLITTDYVENTKLPTVACGLSTSGTYSTYWSSAPTVADTTNVAKFSPVTSETIAFTGNYGSYSNGRCVSTLLDTSKWMSFLDVADGTGKAEMAIGSPTLNMWVASWNAKYPSDIIYCNKSNSMGYYVGTSSEPSGISVDYNVLSFTEGGRVPEIENMYFPHQEWDSGRYGDGYVLSSASGNYRDDIFYVGYRSEIVTKRIGIAGFSLRPVVCLKSGVEITKNADGTIAIGNVR